MIGVLEALASPAIAGDPTGLAGIARAAGAIGRPAFGFDPAEIISWAGSWALLVVAGIIFIETGLLVGVVFPGDPLLVVTGLLSYQGTVHQPIWLVAIVLFAAALLGNQLGFWIGRMMGPRVFERREFGLISRESVERTQRFFERFGAVTVLFAQFIGVVRTLTPIFAGVGHMDWRRFTMFNALGSALWASGLSMLGWGLGHVPGVADFVTHNIELFIFGGLGITVLVMVVNWVRHRLQAKRGAAHAAGGDAEGASMGSASQSLTDPERDARS